ncbi:hypothetical protein [Streptomyces sp. NPDC058755]|uniref:hypothetical protein n=1 Tax=Streptomyces sp. NPDC058755 TaxID=3346624 RepID=UPI0036B34C8F
MGSSVLIHAEVGLPRYDASHDRPPDGPPPRPPPPSMCTSVPPSRWPSADSPRPPDDLETALADAWSCAVRTPGVTVRQ